MILTTCAACAAPLAHDAPKCARCKVRYCNRTCQMDHWRRGHRWRLATSLYKCEGASISDCEEAVATLEDVIRISRRVCGTNHPTFAKAPTALESAREALARARRAAS